MSWSWWALLLWSSFSRHSVASWDCGQVPREGTEMVLGFMQTSVHCIKSNFFHLRHPGVSNLSLRRSQFSLRSSSVVCQLCGGILLCPGHFKWPWVSVLQQISWAHNVLLLSAGCITCWSCGCLGTTKLTAKNLLILLQDTNGKSVIPLESM